MNRHVDSAGRGKQVPSKTQPESKPGRRDSRARAEAGTGTLWLQHLVPARAMLWARQRDAETDTNAADRTRKRKNFAFCERDAGVNRLPTAILQPTYKQKTLDFEQIHDSPSVPSAIAHPSLRLTSLGDSRDDIALVLDARRGNRRRRPLAAHELG